MTAEVKSTTLDPEMNRILAQRAAESLTDTQSFIKTIFEPEQLIEVRVIRAGGDIRSGFYTDREKLYQDVAVQDADQSVRGIYVVLNEIDPRILQERAPNQINNIARGKATAKENIIRRRWMVLDVDPIKATTESNSSSTDVEKSETFERAQRCEEYLTATGFPEPIRGDSGNGAHLLYRIDLPNDDKSYDLMASVLAKLNDKFGVDVTMKDAPRISKLYGTVARKGADTPERPHRRSRLISAPDNVRVVSIELLQKVTGLGNSMALTTIKAPFTMPTKPITERHPVLKSLVASMVAKGNSYPAILAACQAENKRFSPPKTEREIDREVASIYEWVQKQETKKDISNTELMEMVLTAVSEGQKGISNLFMQEFKGKFVFDHAEARWYEFAGHSWSRDIIGKQLRSVTRIQEFFNQALMMLAMRISELSAEIGTAEEMLKDTAGLDDDDKPDIDDLKNKKKKVVSQKVIIQKAQQFLDVLYYRKQITEFAAVGEGSLGIAGTEWDTDPWVLGCKNGIIDLRTGMRRDGKPEDFIRSTCPTVYDAEATCPKFEKYLLEICNEKKEIVEFLQRFLGMALIGDARYKPYLLLLCGRGRNGKDTLVHCMEWTLGDALTWDIPVDMIRSHSAVKTPGAASSEIMATRGKRMLFVPECEGGFDMSKVKNLSGGGDLGGRVPYGKEEIKFPSSHVVIIQTNNRPNADASDYAFWNRCKCVEFELSYVDEPDVKVRPYERKKNPKLGDELQKEISGILNWLIKGCLAFQKDDLKEPASVKLATATYKDEVDLLKAFIHDECNEGDNEQCQAGLLYNRYKTWAVNLGYKPLSGTKFGRDMGKRYEKVTPTHGTFYVGIGLQPVLQTENEKAYHEKVEKERAEAIAKIAELEKAKKIEAANKDTSLRADIRGKSI